MIPRRSLLEHSPFGDAVTEMGISCLVRFKPLATYVHSRYFHFAPCAGGPAGQQTVNPSKNSARLPPAPPSGNKDGNKMEKQQVGKGKIPPRLPIGP